MLATGAPDTTFGTAGLAKVGAATSTTCKNFDTMTLAEDAQGRLLGARAGAPSDRTTRVG
jgi:hypothetical protein